MSERFDLTGKTAIVTGGAGLIGEHVCRALTEHGAAVVVVDTDEEAGRALVNELDGTSRYANVDVTDDGAVAALVAGVCEEFGSVDVLVNSAYPRNENYGQPFEDVGVDDWKENVDLHLGSYYLVVREVALSMRERGVEGSIVNFASIYGMQAPDFGVYPEGMTSPVEYAAIKGAVLNLTRYLASYLGVDGIRVNAVSPGGIFDGQPEAFVDRYQRRPPLGRMANPEDIEGAVVYLASDAASYVTGHNLVVDGGWTIQ